MKAVLEYMRCDIREPTVLKTRKDSPDVFFSAVWHYKSIYTSYLFPSNLQLSPIFPKTKTTAMMWRLRSFAALHFYKRHPLHSMSALASEMDRNISKKPSDVSL